MYERLARFVCRVEPGGFEGRPGCCARSGSVWRGLRVGWCRGCSIIAPGRFQWPPATRRFARQPGAPRPPPIARCEIEPRVARWKLGIVDSCPAPDFGFGERLFELGIFAARGAQEVVHAHRLA